MYQDCVHLLHPTAVVLRACGVCPSALRRLHIPTANKIYGIFLAVTPLFIFLILFFGFDALFNDITAFLFILFMVMLIIQHITLIASSFLNCKKLIRFFMIMESTQQSLFHLNISQPHSPTVKSQIFWLVLMFLPVTISFIICLPMFSPLLIPYKAILSLVMAGTHCKFRVLMELVDSKYALLNWHLDDLNNRWPLFLPRPPDDSFREFSCVTELRKNKYVLYSQDTRTITADKIRDFNKTHLKLYYAYKTLTSAFSLDGLVCALCSGISIVYFFFLLCSDSALKGKALAKTYALISIVTFTLNLFIILTKASKIKEKNRHTALLVHDLLDEDGHDPEVLEELEKFSLALLHRKANFSAAGFFDLDLKLVSRMACIMAPITLFLVQNDNRPRAGRNRRPT